MGHHPRKIVIFSHWILAVCFLEFGTLNLALGPSALSINKIWSSLHFNEKSFFPFLVHWNISNPIFRIDNTDNIFDVNVGNSPSEYDQVQIQ